MRRKIRGKDHNLCGNGIENTYFGQRFALNVRLLEGC